MGPREARKSSSYSSKELEHLWSLMIAHYDCRKAQGWCIEPRERDKIKIIVGPTCCFGPGGIASFLSSYSELQTEFFFQSEGWEWKIESMIGAAFEWTLHIVDLSLACEMA